MIRIDDSKKVVPSKRLWAMAQWSRFVRPGAVRVGASGGPSGSKVSAFKNTDGKIAVQVIAGTSAQTVTVKVSGLVAKKGSAWVTDNTRDLSVLTSTLASDGTISASVPARAMVTFLLEE